MHGARFRDEKLCSRAGWRFICSGAVITANTVPPGLGHYSAGLGHYSARLGHYSARLGHYSAGLGHYSAGRALLSGTRALFSRASEAR